jgi:hypothetical protein
LASGGRTQLTGVVGRMAVSGRRSCSSRTRISRNGPITRRGCPTTGGIATGGGSARCWRTGTLPDTGLRSTFRRYSPNLVVRLACELRPETAFSRKLRWPSGDGGGAAAALHRHRHSRQRYALRNRSRRRDLRTGRSRRPYGWPRFGYAPGRDRTPCTPSTGSRTTTRWPAGRVGTAAAGTGGTRRAAVDRRSARGGGSLSGPPASLCTGVRGETV